METSDPPVQRTIHAESGEPAHSVSNGGHESHAIRRALVACYSMTGNTRRLAGEIRAGLGDEAELEMIHEPHERHGAIGILRALFDAITRRKPPVLPVHCLPEHYDLLILGGPIWAGRIASPVRTYALQLGATAPRVAFFCTEGGKGAESAFAELEQLCRRAPRATLVVDHEHLPPEKHRESLAHFVSTVRNP